MELWKEMANMPTKNEMDDLRKVLDFNDHKGIKNVYLDSYYKYYVKKYLALKADDNILEIGCGIGRLSEYLSRYVNSIYATDLIDDFIDYCNKIKKSSNSSYIKMSDINLLKEKVIDKAFTLSVFMYILDDNNLINVLEEYKNLLLNTQQFIFTEQLKYKEDLEILDDRPYCKYRTVEQYTIIFEKSGFKVDKIILMGERKYGLMIRAIFFKNIYKYLPLSACKLMPIFFRIDKFLMDYNFIDRSFKDDNTPIDVIFILSHK